MEGVIWPACSDELRPGRGEGMSAFRCVRAHGGHVSSLWCELWHRTALTTVGNDSRVILPLSRRPVLHSITD